MQQFVQLLEGGAECSLIVTDVLVETLALEYVEIDVPQRLAGYSMRRVPELAKLLDDEYCQLPAVEGRGGRKATPWVRRRDAACPTQPAGGAP